MSVGFEKMVPEYDHSNQPPKANFLDGVKLY